VLFSWRRFRERATSVFHLDEEPSRLAMAMAVGVFIGITPLYGLHTLLALAAAFVFRLNKAATITGAWLNLPWFAPFVYGFSLKLGEGILAGHFSLSWLSMTELAEVAGSYLRASPREQAGHFWQLLWDMLFVASMPLLVGTTVVGLVLAVAAYLVTLEAVREVRRLRHHHRPSSPAQDRPEGRPPVEERHP
jgi:uncharacterized protein (DUF2062 family)